MLKINQLDVNNYLNLAKLIVVENRPTQDHLDNFSGLKKYKKEYMEMTEKIFLETFEKYHGSVYFPLLEIK